jgi:transcriptional regulator NrdR family protein
MLCPECGEENNRVIDTSYPTNEDVIVRVRKCLYCGFPWTTEEKIKVKFKKEKTPA